MQLKIILQFFKKLNTSKKILFIVLVGVFLGVLGRTFIFGKFVDNILTRYQEIDIRESLQEDKKDPKWLKTFSPLIGLGGMNTGEISPRIPGVIRFLFKESVSFDSFSLFFPGDLHSVCSYLPEDFWVYYLDKDGGWYLLDEVKNNSLPFYQFRSKMKIFAYGIEIVIINPAIYDNPFYGGVWYKDLKFYEKERVNLWEGIKYFVNENRSSLPAYWIYYFLFMILLFLPGFVIISLVERVKKIKIEPDLKFVFCPIISIIFMFLGSTLYFITGIKICLSFYLIIFVVTLILFLKFKIYKDIFASKLPLACMMIALFVVFLVISHRDYLYNLQYVGKYLDALDPVPIDGYAGYFGDNLFPWRIARVFLHRMPLFSLETQSFLGGTTVFDRTPLLPMIIAGILNIFGEGHFVYQRFIEVLGVLFYGTFYVLIKKYFSKKVAIVSLFLMLINVPLLFLPFNAEYYYKYFSMYPILLAVNLFIFRYDSKKILIGILAGLSFLIHPLTLIYSMSLMLLYFLRYKNILRLIKNTLPIPLILIFLCGVWFYSPKLLDTNKNISTSKNGPQSFYFKEITKLDSNLVRNKIINFIYIFIPNILMKGVSSEKISLLSEEFRFEFLRYSLISNITPIIFLFFSFYIIRNIKKNYEFIILAITPLLIYWIFYLHQYNFFFNYGGGYYLLYPFVIPFILSYVVNQLSVKKNFIKIIVFGSYIVFMTINLYYISGNVSAMKCASGIVKGLFWTILVVFIILSLFILGYGAGRDRKIKLFK